MCAGVCHLEFFLLFLFAAGCRVKWSADVCVTGTRCAGAPKQLRGSRGGAIMRLSLSIWIHWDTELWL